MLLLGATGSCPLRPPMQWELTWVLPALPSRSYGGWVTGSHHLPLSPGLLPPPALAPRVAPPPTHSDTPAHLPHPAQQRGSWLSITVPCSCKTTGMGMLRWLPMSRAAPSSRQSWPTQR